MTQYINKDALVAELRRRMQCYSSEGCEPNAGKWVELISIEHFLNTTEVKEEDLESEQRMRECPYRQVVCTMYEGKILECKGACSWVVDYPKLKELKAQKGE